MINDLEFSQRLQKVMKYYQLSASGFADTIGVQRSSISHLLSGRNKPSLDFVLKVLDTFKEVELYWLLNGKGAFPVSEVVNPFPTALDLPKKSLEQKKIYRIIIFYEDGTFENYNKRS